MDISLSANDYAALAPLLILLLGGLALLLVQTFWEEESDRVAPLLTLATLIAAMFAAYQAPVSDNALLTPWLKFDHLSRFFTLFFLAVGVGITLLASPFFQTFQPSRGEFFFLLLSAIFGLILIGASADFLTLFIGIETLSLSLYVLCGYMKRWKFSAESSMKYFFMGSLAAAFLLYGIALVYGATGTTNFQALQLAPKDSVLFLAGVVFISFALAFEVAAVPFHFWAPDVYEGASTPVTAFMAIGTKVGAFAAFVRVFMETFHQFNPLWNNGIAVLAMITLIYANFVAMRQLEIRRFFAYSGISHAGFLLLPIAVGTPAAEDALLYYLVVYAIATIGAFGVISFLDNKTHGVDFSQIKGLFRRSPWLAAILSLCLLTLAGIPPTVGFFAKFYLFKVAYQAGYYALVIVALLTTILSAYYYLRMVALMFADTPEELAPPTKYFSPTLLVVASLAAIALFSFFPGLLHLAIE